MHWEIPELVRHWHVSGNTEPDQPDDIECWKSTAERDVYVCILAVQNFT